MKNILLKLKNIKLRYKIIAILFVSYYVYSIPPAEVRPLIAASKIVKAEYKSGIKQAMLDGKQEIYLKDIVKSVKWDRVCAFTGYYYKPRDELKNRGEGDYPILSYYDDDYSAITEGPGRIIFIGNKKILASFEYKYNLEKHGCNSFDKTKIVFHKPIEYIIVKSKDKECNADPVRNCDKIDYAKSFQQRKPCDNTKIDKKNFNCSITLIGE